MNSPLNRQQVRRHGYSRTRAPTKAWRAHLVEACVTRVKASRQLAISHARHARSALLAQEAAALRDVDRQLPDLSTGELHELIDELEAVLEAERRAEEGRAVRMQEEDQVAEMAEMEREVQELVRREEQGRGEGVVMCPVCAERGLMVREGVVFCGCGLRLDGGTYDHLTLEMVRERLLQVIEAHAEGGCSTRRAPTFSCRDRFGFTFMHAYCDACNLDCIVL